MRRPEPGPIRDIIAPLAKRIKPSESKHLPYCPTTSNEARIATDLQTHPSCTKVRAMEPPRTTIMRLWRRSLLALALAACGVMVSLRFFPHTHAEHPPEHSSRASLCTECLALQASGHALTSAPVNPPPPRGEAQFTPPAPLGSCGVESEAPSSARDPPRRYRGSSLSAV